MWLCTCVETRGGSLVSCSIVLSYYLNQELAFAARLAGSQAPGVPLSPTSTVFGYRHTWSCLFFFYVCAETPKSSCLCLKCSYPKSHLSAWELQILIWYPCVRRETRWTCEPFSSGDILNPVREASKGLGENLLGSIWYMDFSVGCGDATGQHCLGLWNLFSGI